MDACCLVALCRFYVSIIFSMCVTDGCQLSLFRHQFVGEQGSEKGLFIDVNSIVTSDVI